MTENQSAQVISRVLDEADRLANEAGLSGEHGDRGAGLLRMQVRFYRYGVAGTMPPEWQKIAQQVAKEEGPEYVEYQRLRRKFND